MVEKTDKELKEQLDISDKKDKEAGREMSKLRERVLAAQPANNSNCKNFFQTRMHPKVFEMAAKRLRERYTREQVSSTPKQAPAPARANISSISSIESAGELSFGLTSIPSDSSDLALLHAAVDNCETRGVLSNSSDYDLLVTATQTAELNNYQEKGNIINSSTSDSSSSSEPAPMNLTRKPFSSIRVEIGTKQTFWI